MDYSPSIIRTGREVYYKNYAVSDIAYSFAVNLNIDEAHIPFVKPTIVIYKENKSDIFLPFEPPVTAQHWEDTWFVYHTEEKDENLLYVGKPYVYDQWFYSGFDVSQGKFFKTIKASGNHQWGFIVRDQHDFFGAGYRNGEDSRFEFPNTTGKSYWNYNEQNWNSIPYEDRTLRITPFGTFFWINTAHAPIPTEPPTDYPYAKFIVVRKPTLVIVPPPFKGYGLEDEKYQVSIVPPYHFHNTPNWNWTKIAKSYAQNQNKYALCVSGKIYKLSHCTTVDDYYSWDFPEERWIFDKVVYPFPEEDYPDQWAEGYKLTSFTSKKVKKYGYRGGATTVKIKMIVSIYNKKYYTEVKTFRSF